MVFLHCVFKNVKIIKIILTVLKTQDERGGIEDRAHDSCTEGLRFEPNSRLAHC